MASLNSLTRTTTTKQSRVGRGGKRGKTSGRGTKGQNARAGHKKRPEIRDFIKKLPKRRGHGKNRARTVKGGVIRPTEVTLEAIARAFKSGEEVTPKTLVEKKVIPAVGGKYPTVKILSGGTITVAVSVSRCGVSLGAQKAIVAAGGSIA
jgi:large subunit ribosomal protein L15